jgi:ATP-dependent DNA helicase Q1
VLRVRYLREIVERRWRADLVSARSGLQLDVELSSIDHQIKQLQRLRTTLSSDRSALSARIQARRRIVPSGSSSSKLVLAAKKKQATTTVDYTKSDFAWSGRVKRTMKEVWGIDEFRLCQEAAINASLDGREVVCVMPTGQSAALSVSRGRRWVRLMHGCGMW